LHRPDEAFGLAMSQFIEYNIRWEIMKKPKRRIPLPKKTEKVIKDKSLYTRKAKHNKGQNSGS
jgi:hypothetical protein